MIDRLVRIRTGLFFSFCEHISYEVVIVNASGDSIKDPVNGVSEVATMLPVRLMGPLVAHRRQLKIDSKLI